jgi:hypothetical protein
MKAPAIFALALWILIVGGNIVQEQIISPQRFMPFSNLPWLIVFFPIIIVVGAFTQRGYPGEANLGGLVDGQFGQGTYREFIRILRPELLFATMCFGIVFSALARAFLFKTQVMPPQLMGCFASGGAAFLLAYVIRRRRQRV